ncbi:MAG: hypothetical protein ACPHRO_01440, partial [Nannocystaceae bacterium]
MTSALGGAELVPSLRGSRTLTSSMALRYSKAVRTLLTTAVFVPLLACAQPSPGSEAPATATQQATSAVVDPHSAARPALVRTTHAALVFDLDFDARRVRGRVTYDLDRADPA